jgi:hypothetical protein
VEDFFVMMFKKGSAVGDIPVFIIRCFLVGLVFLGVFFISASSVYKPSINVRDEEAGILSKNLFDCISNYGEVSIEELKPFSNRILDYCGFVNTERVYVKASFFNFEGVNLFEAQQGDSGWRWIKEAYESFKEYQIGDFNLDYPILLRSSEGLEKGYIKLEVYVNHEV